MTFLRFYDKKIHLVPLDCYRIKKKNYLVKIYLVFFSYITVIIQRYRVYAVERAKDRYFSIEKWEIIIAFQELTDQLSEYTVITIFVHQHGFTVHFLGSANKIVRNDRPCIYVPVSRLFSCTLLQREVCLTNYVTFFYGSREYGQVNGKKKIVAWVHGTND